MSRIKQFLIPLIVGLVSRVKAVGVWPEGREREPENFQRQLNRAGVNL